jgi:membrane-bound lytic murein transglycosylase F
MDDSEASRREPDSDDDNRSAFRPIPEPLRNWHVIDARAEPLASPSAWHKQAQINTIDEAPVGDVVAGEKRVHPRSDASASDAAQPLDALGEEQFDFLDLEEHDSVDQHDDVIVLGMQNDELSVNPGATVTLQVNLLNNGDQQAVFHLHVTGRLAASWAKVAPLSTSLAPGERAQIEVALTPPRAPSSRAVEHTLAVVATSPDYPDRYSRTTARLTIAPYDDIAVGDLRPRRLVVNGEQRSAVFRLPIANQGNRPAIIQISAQELTQACRFEFARPDMGLWQPDSLQVELEPGQKLLVQGQVLPNRTRWLGLRREVYPCRLTVGLRDEPQVPHILPIRVENRAVMGPWQVATALALLAAAGLLLAITTLAGLLLLQTAVRSAAPAPSPVQPPVIAVMLDAAAPPAPTLQPQVVDESMPAVREPVGAAPVVQADQVSAPNAVSTPIALTPSTARAVPLAPSAPDANLTYAEMFQLVAGQYDIDWRMLAAQAYIESNFDSVALGADGDLGLMQILPNTWREWAPIVGASDPFDAYSNTLVAAAYLDYLRTLLGERGYADTKWMLVAYNWGPDKLLAHLNAGATWDEVPDLRRRYAERILELTGNIPTQ